MGAIYEIPIPRTALVSASNDLGTLIAPSTAAGRVLGILLKFEETTAALNEIRIARSTGGATGSAPITPQPTNTKFAASGFVFNTAWVTQPTLGVVLLRYTLNAVGSQAGGFFIPQAILDMAPSAQLSIRPATALTSNVSGTIWFEEI